MAGKKRKKKRSKIRFPRKPLLVLLLLAVVAGGFWWKYRFSVRGIDVSHHQGQIDWPKVKQSGIEFAYIKATEGRSLKDEAFDRNWTEAKKVGIYRGAYHYFLPKVPVEAQVNHFLSTVRLGKGDLPPALDLEEEQGYSKAEIRDSSLKWLKLVEKRTGIRPILYTMPKYAIAYLDKDFGKYPLWMAKLNWFWLKPPSFWSDWTIWQYSHHGRIDGISEEVDLNYFHSTSSQLGDFVIGN